MSEEQIQTINIKDLDAKINAFNEKLESITKTFEKLGEAQPRGEVVESSENKNVDLKTKVRESFREFLRDETKKVFNPSEVLKEAIGAQNVGSAKPSIWSAEPEILSPAGADGYFLTSIVNWKEDVKGKPGTQVYVQTIAAVATDDINSGTEPTFTASSVSSVPVTLVQKGHGFYISKDDLADMQDGMLDKLAEVSKKAIMRAVDEYMLGRIMAADANAGAGTITEAGVMAATCLAKLWGSLMAGSYVPAAVVMHPVQYASLLQDSQFTNAATRGKSSIIESGVIGNYIGMDIVPLIQGTLVNTGTYKAFMLAQGAICGAVKRDLETEREYYVKDQRTYIVSNIRLGGTVVHQSGIGLLLTVNG